jgi:phage-related protein (TIGR01555 family)
MARPPKPPLAPDQLPWSKPRIPKAEREQRRADAEAATAIVKSLGAGVRREDGWQNLLTGLNDRTRDKRLSANVYRTFLTYTDALQLYRADDMAMRGCDAPAEEMTRRGWKMQVEDSDETGEAVDQQFQDWTLAQKVFDCLRFKSAFGGAGILLGIDDGQPLDQPVDENNIQSIDYLTVLQSIELQGITFYANPQSPNFGKTALFRVVPQLASNNAQDPFMPVVHESRVIQFQGIYSSRRQLRENYGWGETVFNRIVERIRDFQTSFEALPILMQDFSQGVFSMKGLAQALAMDDGTNLLTTRLQAMDMARSSLRSMIIDADGEKFERQVTPMSGIDKALQMGVYRLAAAFRIPAMILMGQEISGLGSDGGGNYQWWYDQTETRQETDLRPQLNRLARLLFLAKDGPTNGQVPKRWSIKFHALNRLTPQEEADKRLKHAQADEIYINAGVLSAQEVAESRFKGDGYGDDIHLNTDLRDDLESALSDAAAYDLGASPDPHAPPEPTDNTSPNMPRQLRIAPSKPKDGSNLGNTNTKPISANYQDSAQGKRRRDAAKAKARYVAALERAARLDYTDDEPEALPTAPDGSAQGSGAIEEGHTPDEYEGQNPRAKPTPNAHDGKGNASPTRGVNAPIAGKDATVSMNTPEMGSGAAKPGAREVGSEIAYSEASIAAETQKQGEEMANADLAKRKVARDPIK